MKKAPRAFAWACAVSTAWTGCYSSAIVAPDDVAGLSSGTIVALETKDGNIFNFADPPTVVNGVITGVVRIPFDPGFIQKQVTLPLGDVTSFRVRRCNAEATRWVFIGLAATALIVVSVRIADEMHKPFWGHSD